MRSFQNPLRGPQEYLPEGGRDKPTATRCCARCRRGVPGFGELPCGYNFKCPCHDRKDSA